MTGDPPQLPATEQLAAAAVPVLAAALLPTDPLVVGVSGGPDSLALLHLLIHGGLHPAAQITVAHLHHGLRPDADDEARFVTETCAAWGVSCRVEKQEVAVLAAMWGLSLEEAARRARYRFLTTVSAEVQAPAVAVAHHADDQVETVLMHFLRGSGLAGLRGMRSISPLPGAPDLRLIRPLLEVERATILAYCAEHNLQPVMDQSNLDTTFFRNRLRHELLPLLESYNPQIRQRLRHTARVLAADYELLQALAREAWGNVRQEQGEGWLRVDRDRWCLLPLSLRRATLRRAVWLLARSLRDVGFRPVEQARLVAEQGEAGAQASLPGDLLLTVEYESWTLAAPGVVPPPPVALPQVEQEGPLLVPGRFPLADNWWIEAAVSDTIPHDEIEDNPDPWTAYVSLARAGSCVVRTRRPGERFQPIGLGGHSAKLKEVMINEKIPAALRDKWPLIANETHLVWLPGHRIDERVRVRTGETVLVLRCHEESVED